MEAQRYPEDFDGYVIGAPVLFLSGLQMKAVWNYQQAGQGPGKLSPEKLDLLSKAVYKKCDALDGLEDGLIENPLVCDFEPARDLEKCVGNTEGPACFTSAQIAGLKKIYEGPRDSSGRQLFPGMPPGGDGAAVNSFQLADTFMKFMAFDPAPGPNWDFRAFNFDTDIARLSSVALKIDATITDLTAVKMRGGKIVHYHGWADPGAPDVGELLRSGDEDHGRKRNQGLLPLLPRAGDVSLRRRTGMRECGLAVGSGELGGEGNCAVHAGGRAYRKRENHANPSHLRLPHGSEVQRERKHRRCGKLHLRPVGNLNRRVYGGSKLLGGRAAFGRDCGWAK
jgi:hypothetical protein